MTMPAREVWTEAQTVWEAAEAAWPSLPPEGQAAVQILGDLLGIYNGYGE